ncbi:uncharacterized protein N7483_004863 [Penicillium malachiteum]|uniref:uncharacterized protein n=1 Tax=Penicillium malachiteum TaxID=1324776 RepID=UPI0025475BCC|nr:uncharacterized protein N7483_004863 [Penicillium malachiteum]KAJ5730355.1 hypothetical protein N7483_004863 [Penicillium malachiteum]
MATNISTIMIMTTMTTTTTTIMTTIISGAAPSPSDPPSPLATTSSGINNLPKGFWDLMCLPSVLLWGLVWGSGRLLPLEAGQGGEEGEEAALSQRTRFLQPYTKDHAGITAAAMTPPPPAISPTASPSKTLARSAKLSSTTTAACAPGHGI